MKLSKILLLSCVFALLSSTAVAAPPDVVLAEDGTLYQTVRYANMFSIRVTSAEGTKTIVPVPMTAGVNVLNPHIRFDDASGTAVVVWQERLGEEFAQLMLAAWNGDDWFGPVAIAGDGGEPAINPDLLISRASTEVDGGLVVESSTIHIAWWVNGGESTGQHGMLCSIPLSELGTPELDYLQEVSLRGMLGIGVVCQRPDPDSALTQPHLFKDVATGNPNVLFFEPSSCSLHILELQLVLEEDDAIELTSSRRRHVPVLGRQLDIGLPTSLPPGGTKFSIGSGLSIVGHWDVDGGINFIHMDEDGWSEERHVPVGIDLSHERAVELIRGLTR
jgi:hypothetical protein